ncbi:MAG: hypothetical protein R3Y43_04170 [Alphaproteobacteria bacterium]
MKKAKKNIIDELIRHEVIKLDEICDALVETKILKIKDWKGYISESDVFCWFEENPSVEEKRKVLTALGYDVSNL